MARENEEIVFECLARIAGESNVQILRQTLSNEEELFRMFTESLRDESKEGKVLRFLTQKLGELGKRLSSSNVRDVRDCLKQYRQSFSKED